MHAKRMRSLRPHLHEVREDLLPVDVAALTARPP